MSRLARFMAAAFYSRTAAIVVSDNFNRADSATSLGTANTGQTWTNLIDAHKLGISGNKVYPASLGTYGISVNVVDSGIADAKVTAKFDVIGKAKEPRLLFRVSNASNFIYLTNVADAYVLYKSVSGNPTQIGAYSTTPSNGDVLSIKGVGSSLKVYINGTERISVTETYNQTETKHGLAIYNSDGTFTARIDDFKVEAV